MDIELFDPNMPPTQPKQNSQSRLKYSLWRFYNKNNELSYISQKPNPAILMNKDWWFDTAYVDVKHFASSDDLIDAKAVAMDTENPAWNTAGRRV